MLIIKTILTFIFLAVINFSDIKEYKIKNKEVVPLLVFGLILGIVSGNFTDCLTGMLLPLVLFPLFALKMLGAGDIKAFCALGAVWGLKTSASIMMFSFVSGGIIAFGFMLANRNFKQRFLNLFIWIMNLFCTKKLSTYDYGGKEKSYFRFSYAITLGVICAVVNNYFCIIEIF